MGLHTPWEMAFPMVDDPAVHHTWVLVYPVNQRLHTICDLLTKGKKEKMSCNSEPSELELLKSDGLSERAGLSYRKLRILR